MPIRKQHRWLYPIDWQQLTDMVLFERAKGHCEQCWRPHGKIVCHLGDGRWWDAEAATWRDDRGRLIRRNAPPAPSADHAPITTVYLATAHLDNNPGHNDGRNLKALPALPYHLRPAGALAPAPAEFPHVEGARGPV